MRRISRKLSVLMSVMLILTGASPAYGGELLLPAEAQETEYTAGAIESSEIPVMGNPASNGLPAPEYSGYKYVEINNNVPFFDSTEITAAGFEQYSDLDSLGRCGTAFAGVCKETIPTEERGEIGNIKPSGWNQVKYEGIVNSDPPYLYNRCHLIGYQLTGENANEKNLITGTRYLNVGAMLTFENAVASYLNANSSNHVLYRVTPDFQGDNLVASGVLMEAYSVEDSGEGIEFCVYCYNVQPGVEIDYADGSSTLNSSIVEKEITWDTKYNNKTPTSESGTSVIMVWLSATGSKYHKIPNCGRMNPDKATQVTLAEALERGKERCENCWGNENPEENITEDGEDKSGGDDTPDTPDGTDNPSPSETTPVDDGMQAIEVKSGEYSATVRIPRNVPFFKKKKDIANYISSVLKFNTESWIYVKSVKATKPKYGITKVTIVLKGSNKEEKTAVKAMNKRLKKIAVAVEQQ